MRYGKEIQMTIKVIARDNLYLLNSFDCGALGLNSYLIDKSYSELQCGNGVTKLFINNNNNDIVAYYTLACGAILYENHNKMYFSPSVKIESFAVNKEYQDLSFSECQEDGVFSDFLIAKVIMDINNFTNHQCGARNVILYSVPNACAFYKRNGFEKFEKFMKQDNSRYLNGCIPMFLEL